MSGQIQRLPGFDQRLIYDIMDSPSNDFTAFSVGNLG